VADVIAFDQRGTGQSGDLPICSIPDEDRPPLSEPLTETRAAEWYSEQAKRCLEFWKARGIDIDGYNTLESVGDLEALRIALGARRLNLWSISYGSHLAMAAIKQMEGRVGRVVMAGAEGPDETVKLPARHEAFLAHVSGLVRDDPDVGARYPDFLGTMHTVLDSVEQHPVIVPVESADGDAIEVAVSRFVLQVITAFQAKNPDGLRTLPALFYAMANGDFGFAASGYLQIHAQFLSGLRAMPLAMDYASGISEERRWLVTEQAQNAAIGNALNFPFPQLFGSLEITDLGPEYRRSVRTDVPTLFLSGTLDGRTFLTAHMETMQGFSRASHIIIENAGHDMFMSHPDLIPLITRFFAGDSIPDTRLHVEPPDFL
jgi:pimeloyl-ACP methyl ester carboxylesterase